MKNMFLGPTEIIFVAGFFCFCTGIGMKFGVAWGLIAAGSILLLAAFRNAAERAKGS